MFVAHKAIVQQSHCSHTAKTFWEQFWNQEIVKPWESNVQHLEKQLMQFTFPYDQKKAQRTASDRVNGNTKNIPSHSYVDPKTTTETYKNLLEENNKLINIIKEAQLIAEIYKYHRYMIAKFCIENEQFMKSKRLEMKPQQLVDYILSNAGNEDVGELLKIYKKVDTEFQNRRKTNYY